MPYARADRINPVEPPVSIQSLEELNVMPSPDLALPLESLSPPILIAKANVQMRGWGNVRLSDEPRFKRVITSCLDVRGYANIDKAQDVLAYLGYREDPNTRTWSPHLDLDKDIRYSVLQQPEHGIVGEGIQYGAGTYGYQVSERNSDKTPSYFGPDKVIYQVEVKGQKFKVVFNLLSIPDIEWPGNKQRCESTRFSLSDTTAGAHEAWVASAQLSAVLAEASGVALTEVGLTGTAAQAD